MLLIRADAQTSPISAGSPTICITGSRGRARYLIMPISWRILTRMRMGTMTLNSSMLAETASLTIDMRVRMKFII